MSLYEIILSQSLSGGGISQDDADARYLQLSGGTMTGNIALPDKKGLLSNNKNLISRDGSTLKIGDTSWSGSYVEIRAPYGLTVRESSSSAGNILSALNTQANPTLSGGETTLTSLKLNGTNYAVGGGSMYQHYVQVYDGSRNIVAYASVITSSGTPFTYTTFAQYLRNIGMVMDSDTGLYSNNHIVPATGFANVSGNQMIIGITGHKSNDEILVVPYQNSFTSHTNYTTNGGTFFDTVTAL